MKSEKGRVGLLSMTCMPGNRLPVYLEKSRLFGELGTSPLLPSSSSLQSAVEMFVFKNVGRPQLYGCCQVKAMCHTPQYSIETYRQAHHEMHLSMAVICLCSVSVVIER